MTDNNEPPLIKGGQGRTDEEINAEMWRLVGCFLTFGLFAIVCLVVWAVWYT
jgi:hypothetical protein